MKTHKLVSLSCLIIIILLLIGCKDNEDETELTVVEGYVLNYYNNKPIDSALITIRDYNPGGEDLFGIQQYTFYDKIYTTYTDKNGYYCISILAKNDLTRFLQKSGYIYNPDWGYIIDNGTKRISLLKPDSSFCATIINKGVLIDSLKISFLDFKNDNHVYVYGDNVVNNKVVFPGNGPWNICDNCFVYFNAIDNYLKYTLEIKRNGLWTSTKDSVYLEWSGYNESVIEIE